MRILVSPTGEFELIKHVKIKEQVLGNLQMAVV